MFGFLESDTGLAHVELSVAMLGPFGFEPCEQLWVAVDAHVVESDVILLRADANERQRLFRIAMIARRIEFVRNDPAHVAVRDDLFETGRNIFPYRIAHR